MALFYRFLCTCLLWGLATLTQAQSVYQTQLPNGLRVFIKPEHRAPIAIVMLWYDIGSADEPGGITGISHAMEHMMFKGTPTIPMGEFSHIIASHGGQENAFTSQDYTAYFEKISTHALETALKLEADRMQHLNLSADEFAKEIKVVQEERRLRTDNDPQALTQERFMATAHLSPPYQHPTIGWMADLTHLSVQDLRAWYQHYYAPNNARLVIVGDVDPATITPLITHYFGPITKQTHIIRRVQTEPPGLGPKHVDLDAPAQQPLLLLGYTVPTLKNAPRPEEAYALELLTGILDAGNNARLTQSIVQTQHLASVANAYYNLYARYPSQWMLFAVPATRVTPSYLKQALLQEIHLLKTTLVPPHELQRIKTQLIAQKTFQQDALFGQAFEIGLLETVGLGFQVGNDYAARIQAITAEQLRDTAKRYFNDQALTEAVLHPILPKERL